MPATKLSEPKILARVAHQGVAYEADLTKPISLALPLKPGPHARRAWGAPPTQNRPVVVGDWVGEVSEGAAVNFATLTLTPHGAGTHTESFAHIAPLAAENHVAAIAPAGLLLATFFDAPLKPRTPGAGQLVDLSGLHTEIPATPALIVRALGPSHSDTDFSGSDPPYFSADDMAFLADNGVEHLVTDLPSLDREEDGGALLAHRAFWKYPGAIRRRATVTELARLNQAMGPGLYLISLNVLPVHADASPSHPILYALSQTV